MKLESQLGYYSMDHRKTSKPMYHNLDTKRKDIGLLHIQSASHHTDPNCYHFSTTVLDQASPTLQCSYDEAGRTKLDFGVTEDGHIAAMELLQSKTEKRRAARAK
jgi:hypothetical protein